jgi:hypothetical protein
MIPALQRGAIGTGSMSSGMVRLSKLPVLKPRGVLEPLGFALDPQRPKQLKKSSRMCLVGT